MITLLFWAVTFSLILIPCYNNRMPTTNQEHKPRVLDYLKTRAPFSIIDRGIGMAAEGQVLECVKGGSKVTAVIQDREREEDFTVVLDIVSGKRVIAQCRCASDEDMEEQWCHHAVASLWRAADLGFFDPYSGFVAAESTLRMNTKTPEEIAKVFNAVNDQVPTISPSNYVAYFPEVKVSLALGGDRLGVKVYFDDIVQEPHLFDSYSPRSARALDNLLLQILDDEGSWDDASQLWYINSSSEIELVLGLIREYDSVQSLTGEKVEFADAPLEARVSIDWQGGGAELSLKWVLPNGEVVLKEGELLGTGPYWTFLEQCVYKLSPLAARLASIFPYAPTMVIPRTQVGPILAILNEMDGADFIEVCHPELQPTSEVKAPKPVLDLERKDLPTEHFSSQNELTVAATLSFDYPTPPKNKNHVYLPDHEREKAYRDELTALKFRFDAEKDQFIISGDFALDFISENVDKLSPGWTVEGLRNIRQQLRFAKLELNVNLSSSKEPKDGDGKTNSGIDWFDCHVSLVQNNANVPISVLFKDMRKTEGKWLRLDSGAYAKVPGGGIQHLKATLGILDPNFRLSNSIKSQINGAQALGLSTSDDPLIKLSLDAKLKSLVKSVKDFSNIERIKPSKKFEGSLRSYQEDGLVWLNFLNTLHLGGILADEMGLGKTVQTIALLQYLKESRKKDKKLDKPAMIIAPTSVITNWNYELRRFAPKLNILLLHGKERKKDFKTISDHDVVITSYALLRLDYPDLEKHHYSYIILDEAQYIKNPQAATTRAAKTLRAEHRLALTGTPTENRPLELWSLFDFLIPGYLGDIDYFRNSIEKPILEGSESAQVASSYLQKKTSPFILRRLKEDVEKDLPPKTESELHVEMTDSQLQMYRQILDEVRPKVLDAVKKKGVRGATVSILAALLRLRQICNHPASIESMKHLDDLSSGKFELFKELIREAIDSGRKILVFCQFREMMKIMQEYLNTLPMKYLYLDGATKNRQDLVDEFNENEEVKLFLISLKAGGTGLNLTAADTVMIYDPWWNPAVESQAIDRAHRIGQTKKVTVYRLVTENSIEQKIMDLKKKKEKIVDALINENTTSPLKLTSNELQELFNLDMPPSGSK